MKRILAIPAMLAAAAIAFTGCSESFENTETADSYFTVVEAEASLPANNDTRVSIGEYDTATQMFPLSWDGNESIAVVNGDETYFSAEEIPEATIKETDGKSAKFEVTLPADKGYTYYAMSPYSAVDFNEDQVFYFRIPTVQTPTDTSADPESIIMFSSGDDLADGALSFQFRHILAYAKMTIKGIESKTISTVEFAAAGSLIAGGCAYMYEYDYGFIEPTDATNRIIVDASNLTADSNGNFSVWMSVLPTTIDGKFTVTVTDTAGKKYTKECDASGKPLEFEEGFVTGFTVNMAPKVEEEIPNTYVVIAKSSSGYFAMSNVDKSGRLAGKKLSDYSGQNPYETSDNTIVWTVIDNGNGTYYLENGGNYLYWSNGNYASVSTTPLALNIDFTNGHIQVSKETSRYLLLNASPNLDYFGFYTSTPSATLIRDLLIVPANGNTGGGNQGGNQGGGDGDDNPGGNQGGNQGDVERPDGSTIYRTGWAELPYEFDADGNGRDDKNNTLYYAHHLCAGGEKNAQNNGTARNYTVCFSSEHHCPVWIAAPRHSRYNGSASRTDAYAKDPDIPASIQYSSKSTGGGCNKGHMLGSAERTSSSATNRQVFYYTNIAPQYTSNFNTGGGAWNILEDWVDGKVCSDTTYVVIGAYFDTYKDKRGYSASPKKIEFGGRNDVSCPTMFYYILLRTKKGNTGKSVSECSRDDLMCAAFVRAHSTSYPTKVSVSSQDMISVAELEQLTGFTFFANVPNAPKDTYNPSDWGL